MVLISTPNKDLADFNPSIHSYNYYSKEDLAKLFRKFGFQSNFYGFMDISNKSLTQKILSFVRKSSISLGLMPKTMEGKKILKRIVFGKLIPMPSEISGDEFEYYSPATLENMATDKTYKVIYCVATLNEK